MVSELPIEGQKAWGVRNSTPEQIVIQDGFVVDVLTFGYLVSKWRLRRPNELADDL